MDQHGTQSNIIRPVWLKEFLGGNFFQSCSLHQTRRNELNKYCIYCNKLCCQFCVSFGLHRHHKMLKVSRHVNKDVVSQRAMEKYFDCSQIQTYKSNRRLVVSLNPLDLFELSPNAEESCKACSKKLNEPHLYSYCSISCKVVALSKKPEPEDPASVIIIESSSGPSSGSPPHSRPRPCPLLRQTQERAPEPSKRKRKRKGSPHRSPLQ
ncbi:protein RGF1 INDUCIBLE TRANSCRIPTION FACTOR 1-like [Vicia villosa]|uniref:protein RGF1 INDUCIBLE TRANSCRIPTION FACTOR 1-like n=1 Tax=Vicia villosa TaxID=3911 RepID=UPI00273C0CBC|nr:protein RGF1 INDUCIBLE TRANSCRIPTION FACTOR 1-like [Vicia villosa]